MCLIVIVPLMKCSMWLVNVKSGICCAGGLLTVKIVNKLWHLFISVDGRVQCVNVSQGICFIDG